MFIRQNRRQQRISKIWRRGCFHTPNLVRIHNIAGQRIESNLNLILNKNEMNNQSGVRKFDLIQDTIRKGFDKTKIINQFSHGINYSSPQHTILNMKNSTALSSPQKDPLTSTRNFKDGSRMKSTEKQKQKKGKIYSASVRSKSQNFAMKQNTQSAEKYQAELKQECLDFLFQNNLFYLKNFEGKFIPYVMTLTESEFYSRTGSEHYDLLIKNLTVEEDVRCY